MMAMICIALGDAYGRIWKAEMLTYSADLMLKGIKNAPRRGYGSPVY